MYWNLMQELDLIGESMLTMKLYWLMYLIFPARRGQQATE